MGELCKLTIFGATFGLAFMERSRAKVFCLSAVGANHDFSDGKVVIHKDADNIGKVLPRIEIFRQLKTGRKDFQVKNAVEGDGTQIMLFFYIPKQIPSTIENSQCVWLDMKLLQIVFFLFAFMSLVVNLQCNILVRCLNNGIQECRSKRNLFKQNPVLHAINGCKTLRNAILVQQPLSHLLFVQHLWVLDIIYITM